MRDSYRAKSRIGILTNQENDCSSPDSRIRFLQEGVLMTSTLVGMQLTSNQIMQTKNIKAMGYILVQ